MKKLLYVLVILGIVLQSCSRDTWSANNIFHKPAKASKSQGKCYRF